MKLSILLSVIVIIFFSGLALSDHLGVVKVGLSDENKIQVTQSLVGQVLKGSKIESLPRECSNQYFLKNDTKTTWLVPAKENYKGWSTNILSYSDKQVEVVGYKDYGYSPCKYGKAAECGCNSYVIVDTIDVLAE